MFEPLRAGLHSETHAVCASKQMSTLSPENAPPNRRSGLPSTPLGLGTFSAVKRRHTLLG
jgi:hypothetical protein